MTVFNKAILTMSAVVLSTNTVFAADLFDRTERNSLKDTSVLVERKRPECSASVALTTDYVFRGLSQTDEGPAISGSFDCSYKMFYVGVWASNIDFNIPGAEADIEVDLYGGVKGKVGQFELDLGVIYYAYPTANDDILVGAGNDPEFLEVKFAVSTEISGVGLSGAVNWTDNFFGLGDDSVAFEGGISFSLGNWGIINPNFSGALGHQAFDNNAAIALDDYTYWNAGVDFTVPGHDKISVDLRYHDTYLDQNDNGDERFVATVSSSW